jgi:hypothetical protein
LIKSRRFIESPIWQCADGLRCEAWGKHGASGSGFP